MKIARLIAGFSAAIAFFSLGMNYSYIEGQLYRTHMIALGFVLAAVMCLFTLGKKKIAGLITLVVAGLWSFVIISAVLNFFKIFLLNVSFSEYAHSIFISSNNERIFGLIYAISIGIGLGFMALSILKKRLRYISLFLPLAMIFFVVLRYFISEHLYDYYYHPDAMGLFSFNLLELDFLSGHLWVIITICLAYSLMSLSVILSNKPVKDSLDSCEGVTSYAFSQSPYVQPDIIVPPSPYVQPSTFVPPTQQEQDNSSAQ